MATGAIEGGAIGMDLKILIARFAFGLCQTSLLGCSNSAVTEPLNAQAIRTTAGANEIIWAQGQTPRPVDVFMATSPIAKAAERKQLADDIVTGKLAVAAGGVLPGQRLYFWVQGENNQAIMIAERVLPLEGGRNFRDLGGYQTATGKVVKWGVLYRSGVMSELTQQDHTYLKNLGIAQICDFRSIEERTEEPTNWQSIGAVTYSATDYEDPGSNELRSVFMKGDSKPQDVRQAIRILPPVPIW